MRKFFIALFLIFFAHCECVLGGAPSQGGSGEIVEGEGELVNCNQDQYRYNGECEDCPPGTTTSSTTSTTVEDCNLCKPGYYSEGNEIIECSFDHYCPGGEGCLAKECPAGTSTIDNEGAYPWDSADDCLFNAEKCKEVSGYYVNNEKCDICPAGYYCPAGQLDRVQCPPETPVSDPGSGEISNCRAITGCADVAFVAGCGGSDDNAARIKTCRNMKGCYWNETEKKCADCSEGFYCTNCSEKEIECPTGTTSVSGAKQKSDCYLKYNKLKQNDTEIKIPSMSDPHATQLYTGHLYFYSTVPENCPPASAVCPAPDGTGGVAGGIVSQK